MDKGYYREYFHLERAHWWFRARAEILMGYLRGALPDGGHLKILNVGVATGRSTELLRELGEVTSVEYDGDCCAFTRRETGLDLLQASVTHLPFPENHFDLVCAFDVIEHVEDDTAATNELCRVCRPGGVVCVTVPAFMFLWSQHDDVNHHFRRYTAAGLEGLIRKTGMKRMANSYFNFWLFFPIAAFRVLGKILPRRKREDSGSDFFAVQSPLLDRIFYAVFRTEAPLVRGGWHLPVGVSLLSSWRKATAEES